MGKSESKEKLNYKNELSLQTPNLLSNKNESAFILPKSTYSKLAKLQKNSDRRMKSNGPMADKSKTHHGSYQNIIEKR